MDGQQGELSPKDFELLHAFVSRPRRVLSRERLLELVGGEDFYGAPRTVDVHIRWLREKIEPEPSRPRHIQTVRGVGYKLVGAGADA